MNDKSLIIIGASARAAGFSAYRAGYAPYWLDRFGDEDLRRRFPGRVLSGYPEQALELLGQAPDAPFIYTGALENHPGVLEELCRRGTLLGNPVLACSGVRDPSGLYEAFRRNGVPCPEINMAARVERGRVPAYNVRGPVASLSPCLDDWLLKPLRGAGGVGIEHHNGQPADERYYLQQYLTGENCSAVFVGGQGHCRLLGVTRQLVGLPEFHAGEFSYCGSIGPLGLEDTENGEWRRIGEVISAEFELKGLFGVDAIKREDGIYPVEVNPRYTASVEVLELALDLKAIQLHCDACNGEPVDSEVRSPRRLIGKAILFAPQDLSFTECVGDGFSIADIPAPGTEIQRGHPVLTVLVNGGSIDSVTHSLKRAAGSIYESLGVEQDIWGQGKNFGEILP